MTLVSRVRGLQAHVELTQEVGHAPVSLAPTQVQDPLPEHGCVDQGIAPERIANARAAAYKIAHGLVRDEHRLARGQCAETMVHHVDVQTLQIGNVARDVEREYLTLAVVGQLVAVSKAVEDQAALMGAVALAHEVLTRADRPGGPLDGAEI